MKSKRNIVFSFLLGAFGLLFPGCEKEEMSDFKHSYIKFELLNQEVKTDTAAVGKGSGHLLTVKSQSNTNSKPRFYKKTDIGDFVEMTGNDEITLVSQIYGSGYREVRNIAINLNNDQYINVKTITYQVQIGDKNKEMISGNLVIAIE